MRSVANLFFALFVCFAGVAEASTAARANSRNGDGTIFAPVRIGGGGFIRGFSIAPDGTKVAKTDTYGAWTFDPTAHACGSEAGCWRQCVTMASMPAKDRGLGLNAGVYEIVVAPARTDVFYMYFNGRIYASRDRCATWTRTGFPDFAANANAAESSWGRYIAVDPANADIVFAGTPSSGVYFTANGGDSWSRIPTAALPAAARAESQGGGNIIAFDPTSAVVGGATQGIYASSYGVGVFHTTDGGKNWAAIPSSPATMRHMIADQTGVVWLVDNSEGSLHRFASGEWAKTGAGSGLRGVAVNPHDANAVYAIQNGALVVSNDGGKSLERTDAVLANRRRHSLASNHQRELHDCGGHRFRSVAVERPLFRRGRRRMAHESAVARRTGRVDFAKRRHRATGCQRNRQSVGRARCARRGGLGSMRVRSEPAGAISKKRRHDQRLPTHSLGLVRRLGLVGSVDGRGDVSRRRQSDRHERLFLRRRRDVDHIRTPCRTKAAREFSGAASRPAAQAISYGSRATMAASSTPSTAERTGRRSGAELAGKHLAGRGPTISTIRCAPPIASLRILSTSTTSASAQAATRFLSRGTAAARGRDSATGAQAAARVSPVRSASTTC